MHMNFYVIQPNMFCCELISLVLPLRTAKRHYDKSSAENTKCHNENSKGQPDAWALPYTSGKNTVLNSMEL